MTEQSKNSIHHLIREPLEGQETIFTLAREIREEGEDDGDGGHVLRIERRDLPELPVEEAELASSKARQHEFHSGSGFIDYLKKYGDKKHVAIFADAHSNLVQASLNEISDVDREVITLKPKAHPRWSPFRRAMGKKLPLEDMVQLLRENRRAIEDGQLVVGVMSQVTCATEVTLHKGEGRNALNGVLVKNKITGGGTSETPVALPESITIVTPVLVDEPPQSVEVDLILSASRDGSEIFAQLSSADLLEAEIAGFDNLVERLRSECEGMLVAHGSLSQRPWRRVSQ